MLKKSCFLILFLAIVLSLPKAILALTGDFDGSGIVDGKDLMKFARSFGSKPGDFNWNPAVDVDNNSVVNGNDLMSFAVNFGKSTPPAPSNFKAAPGNGQVSLTWTNPTNADFAGVKVVRKTGGYPVSVIDGTLIYTGTGTGYTDTGLTNDTTYYYAAFSYDEVPNYSAQSPSAQDSATPYTGASGDTIAPGLPTGISASYDSTARVTTVTWTDQTTTTESPSETYSVYRYTAQIASGNIASAQKLGAGIPRGVQVFSYAIPSTTDGAYYYAATSRDGFGNESSPVSIATGINEDNISPSQVGALTVTSTGTGSGLDLSWTILSGDVAGYRVYRSNLSGFTPDPTNRVGSPSVGSFNDTGLTTGATYYYKVTAIDELANEGTASSQVSGIPIDTIPPSDITGVTAVNKANFEGTVTVSWNASGDSDLNGYKIYYSTGAITNVTTATLAGTVGNGTTSFDVTGLNDGTAYTVAVTALDKSGNEETAPSSTATATPLDGLAPSALATVTAASKANSEGTVTVTWLPSTAPDVNGYMIYRSSSSFTNAASATLAGTVGPGTTSYDVIGLTDGTAYYFAVTAIDEASNENKTITQNPSATPTDTAGPVSPTNFKAAPGNNYVSLSWTNPTADFVGLKIIRKQGVYPISVGDGTQVYDGTLSGYADTGVTNDTTYYYAAFAYDEVPNYSALSPGSQDSATPYSGGTGDTTVPGDPAGVAASYNASAGITTVTWTDQTLTIESPSETYSVYRYTAQITSGNIGAATKIGAGIPKGTRIFSYNVPTNIDGLYFYAATSRDTAGNESGPISITSGVNEDRISPNQVGTVTITPVSTGGGLDLTWTAIVGDTTGYRVYRSLVSGFTPDPSNRVGTPASSSFSDIGLTNGTTYYYKVTAIDELGNEGAASAQAIGTPADITAPSDLTGITAVNKASSEGTVTVGWSASGAVDLNGYKIYRSTGNITNVTLATLAGAVGSGTTSLEVTGLTDGTLYYFAVTAIDSSGNEDIGPSFTATATPADGLAPSALTTVTAANKANSEGTITVSWLPSTAADANGYKIYRSTSSFTNAASATLAGTVTPGTTSYDVTGLTDGATYYFAVTAIDEVNNEKQTVTQNPSATPTDMAGPASPTIFRAAPGNGQVVLSWTNPTTTPDFAGVKIVSKQGGYPTSVVDGTVVYTGTGTGYTDIGLTNDITYYYAAFAYDEVPNYSVLSPGSQDSATPYTGASSDTTSPDVPTVVAASYNAAAGITTITWTDQAGAVETPSETYSVYRYTAQITSGNVGTAAKIGAGIPKGTQVFSYNVPSGTDNSFYYAVTGRDSFGNESGPTSITSGVNEDRVSPSQVGAVTITPVSVGGGLDLTWTAIAGDTTGYRVYRSLVSGFTPDPSNRVGTPATASFSDSGLTNGTTYYYKVTAIDELGNEGTASAQASAFPADTTAPSDVTGVAAINKINSEGTVTVSWSASGASDLNGYKIYRSTGNITNVTLATLVGTVSSSTTSLDVIGLTDGTLYYFAVTAIDSTGNEDIAPSSTATATPLDGLAPSALTTVNAANKANSEGTVTVSWLPSTAADANGYKVYYSTSAFTDASGVTLAGTVGPATTSYNITGLTDGTTYFFGVTAIDEVPNENKIITSNPSVAPVDASAPNAVTGFYASPGNGLVALSWINPTNADFAAGGVKVVRKTGGYPASVTDGTLVYTGAGTGSTDTGLTNDTTYYYATFTYDEVPNYSAPSPGAQDSATPYTGASGDTTPPGLSTGVTASYNSLTKTTTVTWTDQTGAESPAETYSVYRYTAVIDGSNIASAVRIAIGVVKGTQAFGYTIPVDTDGLFYYAVTSSDALGNESAPVSIAAAVDEDNKPPVSVKNLTATAGNAQAALTWVNPTADYVGTLIIRKTTGYPTSPVDGTVIFTDTTNAATYTDTPLSNGSKYYYAAFAYDDVATPNYSALGPGSLDSATPSAAAMTSPSNLAVSARSSSFSATWNAVGGASGYIVYYDNDAAGPPYINAVDVGAATSFALQNIPSLATYYFTVTAYVSGPPYNESPFASEVSATTTDVPVIRITGMDSGVTVKINGISYAAGDSFTAANGTTLTIESTFNGHTYSDVVEAHYDLDIYVHAVNYGATHPGYVYMSNLGYSDYDVYLIESTDTSLLELDIDHWDAAKIIGLHIISPNVHVLRDRYDSSYIYGTFENNGNMTLQMGYYDDYINRLSANIVALNYDWGSSYEYKIQELIANKVTINDRQVSIFNLSITGGNLYAYDFDRNYLNANLPDVADGMVWFKAKNPSVYGLKPGINIASSGGKSVQFGDGYYGDRVFWETKLNEDLYWYNDNGINDAYFLGPYTEINRLDWYYDDDYNDFHFEGYNFGTTWNTLLSNPTTGYGYTSDGARVYSPVNVMKIKSGVFYTDDLSNYVGARFYMNPGQDVLFLSDTNTLDFQCQDGCSFINNTGSHWVVEDDLNYLNYTPDSASIDITTSNIVRNGAAETVSVTANNTYSNSTMYVAYRLKNAVSTQFTKVNMTYSGTEWIWNGPLSPGSYYFYVVAVQNDGYFGKVKEFDIVMESAVPSAPTGVAAESRNNGAHISWIAASDGTGAGVAGYKVRYGTASGEPYGTTVDVGNQTFGDITGLNNGTPYYFVVSAYDYNGNVSGNSSEVSTTPEGLAPAAPAGLSALNPGTGRTLHLSWSANGEGDLGGYYVKYGTATGDYTSTVDAGNVMSYDLTGLTDGTTYYIVISAYDTARNGSGNSSEVSGTPTDTTAPSIVTGAAVSANGYQGELVITWTNPADADYDHLNIYRSPSSGALGDLVSSAISSYQKFTDTGLTTGASYYYTLRPVDGTGNENTTTTQYSGSTTDLLAPKAPTGQANLFSSDVLVNTDASSSDSQYEPDIAVDKNGNVYMVWYGRENSSYYYILFAKSSDGGKTFGTPIRVDNENSYEKYYPAITLDNAGNIYVAWTDYRNNWDGDIYFAKSTNGGTSFSANVRVTDDVINSEYQDYPDITVDGSGNIYIAWTDYRDDSDGWLEDIYLAKSTDGGATFGTNVRVNDSSADDKYYPSIGTDSSGNVYVAWEDQRNGYSDIYTTKSTDGGASFGTNVKANSTTTNSCYRPSMAIDRNDNVHLAWYDNRTGSYDIFYASSTNGGTSFGSNIQVNDGSSSSKYYPNISVDDTGSIHVVWRDYRNGIYDVYYASSTSGGTSFGTNILVDGSTSTIYWPVIASDPSGNVYTAWYDARNGDNDIFSSRFNKPPVVANAYNGMIDVTWQANGETDIAGYKIHYGTVSGAYTTTIDAGNVTTYQLTGMTWNQTYYIAISAYDISGNEGIKSLEASGMTTDGNLPAAPAGLTASDVASDQGGNISLSWNKSADEGAGFNDVTEYRVYRSETSGNYTGSIATVAANTSATYTYTDSTADKLTQYYYIVRAYDGTNESADSLETGPIRGVDNVPPAAPTGILSWVQTIKADFEGGALTGIKTSDPNGSVRLGNNMTRFISAGIDNYDRIYYVQANNNGTFGTPAYKTLADYHRSGGAIADFDNDGDYDIAAANDDTGYAYLIKQTSPGVFASPVQVGSYVNLSSYEKAMAAGDFNEDGNMDFLLAGYYDDIWLYTGDGTGGFTTSIITTDAPFSYAGEMDSGDINEDGHLDFVYSESNGNIYAFYGNGNGTFSSPSLIIDTDSSETYALTLGDFNNDGHLDIIEGGSSSDDLDLYLGDGIGNFTFIRQIIPSDGYYHSVDSYDFDNDGDMDIIIGNASLENVSYYANNGDGTFVYVSKPIGDYAGYYYLYGVAAPDDKRVTVGTLLSSSFDTVSGMSTGKLYFDGNATVTGTAIKFQIRSAATEAGLATAVWYGPAGTADYYTLSGSSVNSIHNGDRWIQYQLTLEGDTLLNKSPVVRSVTITYGSEQGAPFAVDAPNDQGGGINISWKPSADDGAGANDVSGYEIHRSNNPGFAADSTTLIAGVSFGTWGYTDTAVPVDKKPYYYIVRASDGENNGDSLVTGATVFSSDPTGKAIDNIAPAAPTNAAVVDTPGDNGGSINISWTLSTDDGAGANDVAYYDIYRSTASGFTPDTGNKVGSVAAGTSSYIDATATIGASFYYVVRARDGHPNYSSYSEAGSVASSDNVADPPQSLAASDTVSDNGGSITVTWNKSPDEGAGLNNITGYRLYRGTTTGFTPGTSNLITSLTASGAASYTVTDTGATTGNTYYYIARSTTAFYESANSDEVSAASVNNLLPAQVLNLKAGNKAIAGDVLLTWTANTEIDLTGYKLYYDVVSGTYANTVSLGKVTEASLTGLTPGSTYYFALSATDGVNEGPISVEGSLVVTADAGTPAAPTGVSAADTPSDQGKSITVTWTLSTDDGAGADDVAAYDIYRSATSTFTPSFTLESANKIGTVAAGVNTFVDAKPYSSAMSINVNVKVDSAGYDDGNFCRIYVNGTDEIASVVGRGINLVVIDEVSGAVLDRKTYDTNASQTNSNNLATYINGLPNGRIVAVGIKDEAATNLNAAAKTALGTLGATSAGSIAYRTSWALIGKKGGSAFAEQFKARYGGSATAVKAFTYEATDPSNTTVDPAVTNDYYYIVRARDGAGNYADSAVSATAANAVDNTAPGVPAGVKRWAQTSKTDFDGGTLTDLSSTFKSGSLRLLDVDTYIAIGIHNSTGNYIYKSNQNGTFTLVASQTVGNRNVNGFGIADYDNDGDYDIVTGNSSDNYMYIIEQTSPGVFAAAASIGSSVTLSSYVMDIASADFNNDGNYDFIVGGNNRNVYLFTGDGAGGFTTTTITTTAPGGSGRGKDAGDINEDGNMDFIYADYSSGYIYAYYGNGNGTFQSPVFLFDSLGNNDPYGLTLADFTGDGNLDIIEGGSNDGLYNLWAGDGAGNFTWKWTVFDLVTHGGIDNIDFDNDGDQDLVVAGYTNSAESAYRNNGDGTFAYVGQIGSHYAAMGMSAPSHDLYKASGSLVSSTYNKGTDVLDRIYWSGSTLTGTTIKFQIRTAATEAGLDTAQWYGPISATDYYETSGAAINTTFHPSSHEWIQYMVVFETTDPKGKTPQLDSVEITYGLSATVTAYDLAGDDYNRVVVEWSESGDDGSGAGDVTRYDLYRGTTSGFTPDDAANRVAQVTADGSAGYSYTDTVPQLATNYYYKVRAFDATNYSAEATSGAVQALAEGVAPPSNVTVSDVAPDQGYKLKVDWTLSPHDGVDVTGYDILRGDTSGGPYTVVGSAAAGAGTFTDTVPYSNVRPGDWGLASNESFDSGATGWTKGGTAYSTVTNYGDYGNALGGYNQTAGGSGSELSKTYDLSAYPHAKVRIVAEYLPLDTWDTEEAYMKADGAKVFSQNYNFSSSPINVPNTWSSYNDGKITIDKTLDHTGNSLTLLFGSALDSGAADESYAVADVKVYVLNATESADYSYIVRAKDGSGNTSDSNEASGVAHDNIAPAAPTGIMSLTHTSKADFEKGTLTNIDTRMSGNLKLSGADKYIAVGEDGGNNYIYQSNGDGTFTYKQNIGLGYYQRGYAVADFDSDGDYDIITGDYGYYGYMYFIQQTSPGIFASPVQVGSQIYMYYYTMDIAAADFNNDGKYDFVVSGYYDDIYLFTGNGNGTFTTSTITSDAPGSYGRGKDAGDINEDGNVDFVYAENGGGGVYAYYGNGDGTFDAPVLLFDTKGSSNDPYGVTLSDFTGDGHFDIIAGGSSDGQYDLWAGDGVGGFTWKWTVFDMDNYSAVDDIDFDGDGDQDLVVTRYSSYDVRSYKNNGDGTFTYLGQIGTPYSLGIGAPAHELYKSSGSIVSAPYNKGTNAINNFYWKGSAPIGTSIKFQIRSAASESDLAAATWYGPTGTGDYYTVSGSAVNTIHNSHEWIQYKAIMETANSNYTPVLEEVIITYGSVQTAPFVYDTPGDNGGSITVNWQLSSDDGAGVNDVVGYEVHRSITNGFTPDATTLIASVSSGTYGYADNTAVDGTDYYYIVQAKDLENKTPSAQAGPVQSVNDGAPAEVTNLTAVPHDGYIDLSWTNPTVDFAGVIVRRSATAYPATITDGVEVYNGSGSSVSDTNGGANDLQFGTMYYYAVFSYDGIPNYSAGATVSAVPVDMTVPTWSTTTGVQTAVPGNKTVTLTWGATNDLNASTNSSSSPVTYRVYVHTASPATSGTVINDVTSPYTVTGLTNGTNYYFTVRAVDSAANLETNTVELSATPYVKFTDQTAALGLGDTGNGRGVAVADVNGDGTSDIFVANYGSANKLFVNIAGAWFDNSSAAGVAGTTENSVGTLFADFNNDGHPDLYVSNYGSANMLYMNDGDGTFTLSGQAGGGTGNHMGAAVGDIDNDGDLDIYAAVDGSANLLFINNGDGTFTESAATYTIAGTTENSSMAAMVDLNRDGRLDILVVNNGQADQYYEQTAAMTFTEKAATYGFADIGSGRGIAFGDIDMDGDMDVYVTRSGANLLYINGGIHSGGAFTEAGATRGVADASDSMGALFIDVDHDGDLDLYVVNNNAANRLYINDGTGSFTDKASDAGVADAGTGYGVAAVDGDFDGDMDVYVVNSGANSFFRTEQNNSSWLKVELLGTSGNKDAVGARVEVYEAGFIGNSAKLLGARMVTAGSGYASSEDKVLHFGLTISTCDVRVIFPDGTTVDKTSVAKGQTTVIAQPGTVYSNDFDGNVTGLASLTNTSHFHSGAWGFTGNGYWCGEDATYAASNSWSGGAGYGNNWDEKLTISGIDLRGLTGASLLFKMRHDMEANYEFGHLEVSTNGGTTWTAIQSVTGVLQTWTQQNVNLSSYVGNVISLRFRFISDSSWSDQDGGYDSSTNGFDGAFYLDNLAVSGN